MQTAIINSLQTSKQQKAGETGLTTGQNHAIIYHMRFTIELLNKGLLLYVVVQVVVVATGIFQHYFRQENVVKKPETHIRSQQLATDNSTTDAYREPANPRQNDGKKYKISLASTNGTTATLVF